MTKYCHNNILDCTGDTNWGFCCESCRRQKVESLKEKQDEDKKTRNLIKKRLK